MIRKPTPFKPKSREQLIAEDALDENLIRQRRARAEFNKQFKSLDEFFAYVMKEEQDASKQKIVARAVTNKRRTRSRSATPVSKPKATYLSKK